MPSLALKPSIYQFFRRRWQGEVPLRTLFWWDTLAVGTVVNAWVAIITLILLAQGLGTGIWLALFLVVMPYNLFLVSSLWRHRHATSITQAMSLTWLTGTLLI
jgi:hypothetical protein